MVVSIIVQGKERRHMLFDAATDDDVRVVRSDGSTVGYTSGMTLYYGDSIKSAFECINVSADDM